MGYVRETMRNVGAEAITILVTPVWKDSERLAAFGQELAEVLADGGKDVHWIIADDGSGAAECERLEQLRSEFEAIYPRVSLHLAEEHQGKGGVVREAWALEPEAEFLAFVDADGSVSAVDILRLIDEARSKDGSVFGIRKTTDETEVKEDWPRWLRHHGFLFACRCLLGVKTEDTQCGAKVLKGADYRKVASDLVEEGWAFDAELLAALAARDLAWHEVPVNWVRKGGSRIHGVRDAFGMLAALFRIRKRLGQKKAGP